MIFTIQQLKEIDIFTDLQDNQIVKILSIVSKQEYKEGEYIFRQKEADSKIYALISGEIKLNKTSKTGLHTICSIKPGQSFGELALLGETQRDCEAVCASQEVVLAVWAVEDMKKLFEQEPALGCKVLWRLLNKLYQRIKSSVEIIEALLPLTK